MVKLKARYYNVGDRDELVIQSLGGRDGLIISPKDIPQVKDFLESVYVAYIDTHKKRIEAEEALRKAKQDKYSLDEEFRSRVEGLDRNIG